MYDNMLVASVAAVAVIAAVPVRGDSSAAATECAYDAGTGLCVPAELQVADAAALTITGMLGQCMASTATTPDGGCLPGAPEFCVAHEFADEAGVSFCVNQGFTGTSYTEFEDLEEAAMNCIGFELSAECQPVLIAWYEILGCSSCAEVEFAVRACMMRTTAAECGSGTADPRIVNVLAGPGPGAGGAPAPSAAFAPSPADAPDADPYAEGTAFSPYGDYIDVGYAYMPESYYDYMYSFLEESGAFAPSPAYAYGPYAYGPYAYGYGPDQAYAPYDAYGPDEAYAPIDYGFGTPPGTEIFGYGVPIDYLAFGVPPTDDYSGVGVPYDYLSRDIGPSGFDYASLPSSFNYYGAAYAPYDAALGPSDYETFTYNYFPVPYEYADGPMAPAEASPSPRAGPVFGGPIVTGAQPPSGAGDMAPADQARMRRARRARRMRPADPPRERRMRMLRMRRMRRMRRGRMG